METETMSSAWPSRDHRVPGAEAVAIGILALVLAAAAAFAVMLRIDQHAGWDVTAHAMNAAHSNAMGIPFGHFLSYMLMTAPCGFCADLDRILALVPPLVGGLLAAKFVLSYAYLRNAVQLGRSVTRRGVALVAGVALLLGFAFSLPFPTPYLGQFPANQWHNTTTFALMPFALLLFWAATRYLRQPSKRLALVMTIVGLLSIAAKPSFAMAFVPVFPIFLLIVRMERRWKVAGLAVTGFMATGLGLQYLWMYRSESFATLRTAVQAARGEDTTAVWGMTVEPFALWSQLSPSIPLSVMASLLFPVAALAARPAAARRCRELHFAWALFGMALFTYVMMNETGRPSTPANFTWGCIVTMYMLFLASAAFMLAPGGRQGRKRDIIAWSAFGAHVLSGVLVLYVFASAGTYLQNWPGAIARGAFG